jgi:hypothetical protein
MEDAQRDLFKDTSENKLIRQELINQVFSDSFDFASQKRRSFRFSCVGLFVERQFSFAKIFCHQKVPLRTSPDADEKNHDHWPYLRCFVSLSDNYVDNCGHLFFLEHKTSVVNDQMGILRNLSSEINKKLANQGFSIAFRPIFSAKSDFWALIKGKDVESITFSYSIPNFLNLNQALDEDLKDARAEYDANQVDLTLSHQDGKLTLNETNDFLKQSVAHTTKGAGEFRIRLKNTRREIKSRDQVEVIETEQIDISTRDEESANKFIRELVSEFKKRGN